MPFEQPVHQVDHLPAVKGEMTEGVSEMIALTAIMVFSCVIPSQDLTSQRDRLLKQYISASEPYDRADISSEIFSKLSVQDLKTLQENSNALVSVRAAWEVVIRSFDTQPHNQHGKILKLPSGAIERFLGLLEGKLGINLPLRWEQTVRHPSGGIDKGVVGVGFAKDAYLQEVKRNDKPLGVDNDRGKYLGDGAFSINIKGTPILISKEHVPRPDYEPAVSVATDSDHTYLAFISSKFGESFPILCVRTKDGAIVWKARAWAVGGENGFPGFHSVELQIKNQRLWVWGACNSGVYVEEFNLADGVPGFKFCTEL